MMCAISVKPTFKDGDETSRSLASPAGRTVKLSCRATGYPEPRVGLVRVCSAWSLPVHLTHSLCSGSMAQKRRNNHWSQPENDWCGFQDPQGNAGNGRCSGERFRKVHVWGGKDRDAGISLPSFLNKGYYLKVFNSLGTIRRTFNVTIINRMRGPPIIVPNILVNQTVSCNSLTLEQESKHVLYWGLYSLEVLSINLI